MQLDPDCGVGVGRAGDVEEGVLWGTEVGVAFWLGIVRIAVAFGLADESPS